MASQLVSFTLVTPEGVTIAEALRLFTDRFGWKAEDGTRAQFAKVLLARYVVQAIYAQRREEAENAAGASVPDDITAEELPAKQPPSDPDPEP